MTENPINDDMMLARFRAQLDQLSTMKDFDKVATSDTDLVNVSGFRKTVIRAIIFTSIFWGAAGLIWAVVKVCGL